MSVKKYNRIYLRKCNKCKEIKNAEGEFMTFEGEINIDHQPFIFLFLIVLFLKDIFKIN